MVVTSVSITATPKMAMSMAPAARPTLAMIRATSPHHGADEERGRIGEARRQPGQDGRGGVAEEGKHDTSRADGQDLPSDRGLAEPALRRFRGELGRHENHRQLHTNVAMRCVRSASINRARA
jgi:hypothetical protein